MNRSAGAVLCRIAVMFLAAGCGGGGGGGGGGNPNPPPAAVAPSITRAPQSVIVNEGQPASFGVSATGSMPLAYQWLRAGATIAGANAADYRLPAATLADSGAAFAVVVSNSAGTITSSTARLQVDPLSGPPTITVQPQDVTVIEGQPATFAVGATGSAPLTYQWQRNNTDLPNATGASVTLPPVRLGDDGTNLRVRVTNGQGTVTSRVATLNVAPMPMAVIATTPAANATVIEPTSQVIVTFDHTLTAGTVDAASVRIEGPQGPLAGTRVVNGAAVTFTPAQRLALLTPYTVRVSTAVRAQNGAALAAPFRSGFTVRDGRWSAPVRIDNDIDTEVLAPVVALDPVGNALAVWSEIPGRREIWSNTFRADTGWNGAEPIESGQGYVTVGEAKIAMDAAGDAIVVWDRVDPDPRGNVDVLRARRHVRNVGWDPAQSIATAPVGFLREPAVAVDAAGNGVVAWPQDSQTGRDMWATRYRGGIGWDAPRAIEQDDSGSVLGPQVALSGAGASTVVWPQSDGMHYHLWAFQFDVRSGPSTLQRIDNDDNSLLQIHPGLAVDGAGNVLVVWSRDDGAPGDLLANRFVPGIGWSGAQRIASDDPARKNDVRVAFDGAGNAVVVWRRTANGSTELWTRRFLVASGWEAAEVLASGSEVGFAFPLLAVDQTGNAHVAWRQSDGTALNLYTRRYTLGAGWSPAQLLENDDSNAVWNPQLSSNNAGLAIVVWTQTIGGRPTVFAARFE